MAVTAKALIESQYVQASATSEYTVSGSVTKVLIDKFTISNVTGGAVTFNLHIVPDGGSADATNKLYTTKSVAANTTIALDEIQNQILELGEQIVLDASAGSSLVMRASGREVSS